MYQLIRKEYRHIILKFTFFTNVSIEIFAYVKSFVGLFIFYVLVVLLTPIH